MKKAIFHSKYLVWLLPLFIFSCDFSKNRENASKNEVEVAQDNAPGFADKIEVVSVETGWYDEQLPQVKIKFKNISGYPIADLIQVKYQFIENDEVFYEGSKIIHSGSLVAWENGLAKTEIFRSIYGYPYGGPSHNVRAKFCYDDNSLIWEGDIAQRIIY